MPRGRGLLPKDNIRRSHRERQATSFRFAAPLPHDLIQNNAGGNRDIEGWNFAQHWDRDQEVTFFAHEIVQPFSLSAKHDSAIHFVINFVVGLLPPLLETYYPQIFGLPLFQSARNV